MGRRSGTRSIPFFYIFESRIIISIIPILSGILNAQLQESQKEEKDQNLNSRIKNTTGNAHLNFE